MTAIFCDSCKKPIVGARKDVNYFATLDKELCSSCQEELLLVTRQQMAPRQPYLFKDYQQSLVGNLARMTGK
jgi:hypothetical protein